MFNFTSNLETVLPIMALIILSIVRLVPAFSSINTSFYYMKIFEPSLNVLDEEFKKLNINNENFTRSDTIEFLQGANHTENNLITLKNVSFNYPNNKSFKTLKNINMTVEKGDTLGIIGKSGAGKTTLMNLMTGLLLPTEGNIFFENRNIENNINEWRDKISYVSQNIYLLDDTIEKNITFNFNNEKIDKFRLERAIEISNLSKKIKLLPDGIKTCVGNDGIQISGGEKQRIAIARAIYKDPDIIFFDEFTSAIDAQTENEIINSIEKNFKEKTIILIAHREATISRCKSVWQINNGQITKI